MATGGDFGYDDHDLDYQIDHDDDDDDDYQEVNRTQPFRPQPFRPGAASTPYHGGEQHEMQTMMHEQSGLPSYDEKTPLIDPVEDIKRRLRNLRNPRTGIIDTTKLTVENPLSQKDKEDQIRRVKRFIKSRFSNADVDGLVITYSKKTNNGYCCFGAPWRREKDSFS